MTVAELIEELNKFPRDALVVGDWDGMTTLEVTTMESYYTQESLDSDWPVRCEKDTPGAILCVKVE